MIEEIRNRLAKLNPDVLNIEDDSALHAGHAGNGGGGHYRLTIVSNAFAQHSPVMRHRMIYQELSDLIPHRIHALSIHALTQDELSRST